jgi:hypothetical protein
LSAEVDEDVAQAALGDAMDFGGDAFAAAHLRGDDELALVLRLDGQQAGAGDVRVEEGEVGVPCEHGVEHPAALRAVGDEVHRRAGDELHAAPAGVDIYHHVAEGEENRREVVGHLAGDRTLGLAIRFFFQSTPLSRSPNGARRSRIRAWRSQIFPPSSRPSRCSGAAWSAGGWRTRISSLATTSTSWRAWHARWPRL